jgi:steroid 5-alpha reductase family enzyme
MSATGDLDVRVPIGALFTLVGLLLTVYGFLEPVAVSRAFTKGGQINLWWGLVMLAFGVFMLLLARPSRRRVAP